MDAPLPVTLRLVKGFVSVPHQTLEQFLKEVWAERPPDGRWARTTALKHGNTDARADRDASTLHQYGFFAQQIQNPSSCRQCTLHIRGGHQHRKLVSTEARRQIMLARGVTQYPPDAPNREISNAVPTLIVDGLHSVQIDQKQPNRSAIAHGGPYPAASPDVEKPTRVNSRQGIESRHFIVERILECDACLVSKDVQELQFELACLAGNLHRTEYQVMLTHQQ